MKDIKEIREPKNILEFLRNIRNEQESPNLEFKECVLALSKDFWETYSSFANTNGGLIVLGITDKPVNIVGVGRPKKVLEDLFNIASNKEKVSHNIISDENVQSNEIDGKTIITVYIPPLSIEKRPLYLNGNMSKAYIRRNNGDYLVTEEELRRFIRNSQENIDGELLDYYTIDDLDEKSVLEYKNIINDRNPSKKYLEMDNLLFLKEMGIFQIDRNDCRKTKLTLAGLLFLGKIDAIKQKLPHFHLEYFNRKGMESTRWKDRVSTGDLNYPNLNLFQYHKIVLDKLRLTIEDPFELDESCVRKSPVELEVALRESLANMIIHADYLDSETDIKVVADNYFYTFTNPGSMRISMEQFFTGGCSNPRNNTLITYFRRMGACERAGTGGKEIYSVVEKNKFRDPELTTDNKQTSLKLWTGTLENSYPELSGNARKVLVLIRKNNIVQVSYIMQETKLSSYYTYKALEELLEKKYIRVSGKGRATRYLNQPTILEQIATANWFRDFLLKPKI